MLDKYFFDAPINTGLDYYSLTEPRCYFYKVNLHLAVEPGSFCVTVSGNPPTPTHEQTVL